MKDKIIKIMVPLIIIILILCFVWGILAIYKMFVFNKIFKNMKEKVSLNNYYMKMTSKDDKESNMEIFYKNGVGKLITSNGTYTWTNNEESYLIDEENKTYYKLTTDDLGLISNEAVASMLPGYSKDIIGRMILAGKLTTSVKTEKIVGLKYYKIKINDGKQEKIVWVNKNTLLPSEVSVKIGEEEITYNYEIKFEGVKNEQVSKPNLEEYTLKEDALESK